MKKFFIIIIGMLFLFIALNYYSITFLSTGNGFISNKIRHNTPQSVKNFLKKINNQVSEKIFIFEKLEEKNSTIKQLKNRNLALIDKIDSLKLRLNSETIIKNKNLKILKFKNDLFFEMGYRAYLAKDENNIYIMTGMGNLMFVPIKEIRNKEEIILKKINSDFYNLAISVSENIDHQNIVKNILIKNDKLYVSYYKKVRKDCFYNAILVGDLNLDKIEFQNFFEIKECQPFYDDNSAVGGNLADYKNDSILFTIGGWDSYVRQKNNNPQNLNSLIGKIISINIFSNKHKIISIGHRNSQGLFYDRQNDIIYSTDHGPEGGDEINQHINLNEKDIKNFGWGISSYGEHYQPEDIWRNEDLYKRAPLYKSHKKYGFEEPLKYFTPSIGITQIVKNNYFKHNKENENRLYIGSMGWDLSEGDLGIHEIILDKEFKYKSMNFIPIEERVRDFIFLEKQNMFVMFLESDASIGFLEEI